MSSRPPIRIEVEPRFLTAQSSPSERVYAFAYQITITNVGEVAAQLVSRHWIIEEAAAATQEVKGLGVVGQQPLLAPGQSFRYTSGCRLQSPSGTMRGSYFFVTERGDRFDVPIPLFVLEAGAGDASRPRVLH